MFCSIYWDVFNILSIVYWILGGLVYFIIYGFFYIYCWIYMKFVNIYIIYKKGLKLKLESGYLYSCEECI